MNRIDTRSNHGADISNRLLVHSRTPCVVRPHVYKRIAKSIGKRVRDEGREAMECLHWERSEYRCPRLNRE